MVTGWGGWWVYVAVLNEDQLHEELIIFYLIFLLGFLFSFSFSWGRVGYNGIERGGDLLFQCGFLVYVVGIGYMLCFTLINWCFDVMDKELCFWKIVVVLIFFKLQY